MSYSSSNKTSAGTGGSFFLSIRGKYLITGIIAIFAVILIGLLGIFLIGKTSGKKTAVSAANDISVLQSQNLSYESLYRYNADKKYLKELISNLNSMNEYASQIKNTGNSSAATVIDNIQKSKSACEEIIKLHDSRGFDETTGLYAQFSAADTELIKSLDSLVNRNERMDIMWIDAKMWTTGVRSTNDGKEYVKVVFNRSIPYVGKRDIISFRIGGTMTYSKTFYITNVMLLNAKEELPIDLSKYDTPALISGDGAGDVSMTVFDGNPAISVTGKFEYENMTWEEAAIGIDVSDYDIENYSVLQYEVYFEPTSAAYEYKCGGSVSGVYDFKGAVSTLNSMTKEYSRAVLEGKDTSAVLGQIDALFSKIATNIPKYTTNASLAETATACLNNKKNYYEQMKTADQSLLAAIKTNTAASDSLSAACTQIKSTATTGTESSSGSTGLLPILIALIVTVLLLAIVFSSIGSSIARSLNSYDESMEKIAAGDISVRADSSGSDEIAAHSAKLNAFLDELKGTSAKLKDVSKTLGESQASIKKDAEKAKGAVGQIGTLVAAVKTAESDRTAGIKNSSSLLAAIRTGTDKIIKEASRHNGPSSYDATEERRTTSTNTHRTYETTRTEVMFTDIADRVRKTDSSVEKISEAVKLIASIATRTNLLSLNASIEAARAGEAGKGFAVVATEISKLAEQTNSSAKIIEEIISDLSEESRQTVETINAVTGEMRGSKEVTHKTLVTGKETVTETEVKRCVYDTPGTSFADTDRVVIEQAESIKKAGERLGEFINGLSKAPGHSTVSVDTADKAVKDLGTVAADLDELAEKFKKLSDSLGDNLGSLRA